MRDAVTSIAPGKTLLIDSSRELCSYLLLAPGMYASVARIGVTFYSTSGFDPSHIDFVDVPYAFRIDDDSDSARKR